MSKNFYITTTLPYVNADPHIGFAMEIIRADVIARAKKLQGNDVFFNTGTDEHGQKLFIGAEKAGLTPQAFVDMYAEKFRQLLPLLQISDDIHFIRTTDEHHVVSAQHFWKLCRDNGYIYKKAYSIKYCVGCELEKTDSELVDGKCPLHPQLEIELIDEENYFFKFSAFQKSLLDLYHSRPDFVVPDFRQNEIKAFVERGLEDFSISRLASKMPWGIPVPDDSTQVMYVWFDALVNYISTIGWPDNVDQFKKYWEEGTPVQYCGKDNLRQQTAMWQAMLMAAGLPTTHTVVVNGVFTGEGGVKMSKSLGNVVSPFDVVERYGTDALRYYVCAEVSLFEDSPASIELIGSAYNAKLANGLGNLVSRIMKMAQDNLDGPVTIEDNTIPVEYFNYLNQFEISRAVHLIWSEISRLDTSIQDTKPFKVVKENKEEGQKIITELVVRLYTIARMLNPILPETSTAIKNLIKQNKAPESPLFVRKD